MEKRKFETPVLLIIFNRPELTKRVLDRIGEIKPSKLFIASDGPRKDNEHDINKCEETRKLIENINWKCEIKTNFQEKNLGCKVAPYTAIDWFFQNVTEGIILEDDVLPDISFFFFCEELLEKYRYDTRIASISGNNFQFGKKRTADSYYFSKFSHSCGWATWKRAWNLYDLDIKLWPIIKKGGWLNDILKNRKATIYWKLIFDGIINNQITSAWDYQWTFMVWTQNMLSILPNQNLISNIGFGVEGATHTTRKNKFSEIKIEPLNFPLVHPKFVIQNSIADSFTQKNNYILWREIGVRIIKKLNLKI